MVVKEDKGMVERFYNKKIFGIKQSKACSKGPKS
jgi:hypothetical protein